jgi:DNA modification methylase
MMGRKQALQARNLLAILSAKKSQSAESSGAPSPAIELIHSDCLSVIPSLDDNSIDCLITDPPWQVEFDEEFGTDKRTGLQLTKDMLSAIYPKLKDNSLCWLFCAAKHVIPGTIYNLLRSCGYFIYDDIFIWYKPTVAHSSNPYRELKKDYEPALLFSKGVGRDLVRPMFSVFSTKLQGHKLHPAQKPVDMLRQLIEVSTVPNELICDPFMGSGSTMVACKQSGRRGLGIELSDQWFSLAQSEIELSK